MIGNHVVRRRSTTQTVVLRSSGKAGFYILATDACEGLGVSCRLEGHMGRIASIEIENDSSAAKGTATRKGAGTVKHLETRALGVQDQVSSGRIRSKTVSGERNTADALTEYPPGSA